MHQPSDTNSAQKVCRLLRVLSTPQALRLTDIVAGSGVNKATTLRLLETLIGEGFVRRDAATKRYSLGDEALLLGIAMQGRDHIRERARPSLVRLAALSGDTLLLSTRHGLESVCVDREFGSYPIRANYLDLGSRRPLGAGAGSLALLAWLPDDEIEAILGLLAPVFRQRYPKITRELLKSEIALARQRGYTLLLDVVVEQMGGIGVPVLGGDGKPVAAISIAALNQRITPRLPALVPALKKAGAELSAHYAQKAAA
jgi:DNA-binding IclR family transcriptional regulator